MPLTIYCVWELFRYSQLLSATVLVSPLHFILSWTISTGSIEQEPGLVTVLGQSGAAIVALVASFELFNYFAFAKMSFITSTVDLGGTGSSLFTFRASMAVGL